MAQQNRIHGNAIATFTIGGTSYIASCEDAEISLEFDTEDAHALLDIWKYPIGEVLSWSLKGTFFIDTASGGGGGGPGGSLWTKALAATTVAVVLKDNATSGAGNTLSGNALITNLAQMLKLGPQTYSCTLVGQGALASVIA